MISFRPQQFRKIAIIGVGLLGGSIGLAVKKQKIASEVVGLSQHQASLDAALSLGAIDQGTQDLKQAVAHADLVILSTPVNIIQGMLSNMGPFLKRHCIVTDVGSTKSSIVSTAEKHLPDFVYYVGSHPLAGSEKRGVESARPDLFEQSICLVTPTEETNRQALERLKNFWQSLGAQVKTLSPQEHDGILATISHLPHVVAYTLMDSIPKEHLAYAAGGLKDLTRIASLSPQMWNNICINNSKNIIKAIDEMVEKLGLIRKSIATNDHKSLITQFAAAKTKRDELGAS